MNDEEQKHVVYERQVSCRQKEMGSDEIVLEAGATLTNSELIQEYKRVHEDGTAEDFDKKADVARIRQETIVEVKDRLRREMEKKLFKEQQERYRVELEKNTVEGYLREVSHILMELIKADCSAAGHRVSGNEGPGFLAGWLTAKLNMPVGGGTAEDILQADKEWHEVAYDEEAWSCED